MLNEPHRGYIDIPSLHNWDYNTDLHLSYIRAYLLIFVYFPSLILGFVFVQLPLSTRLPWVQVIQPQ
jgi:hypothetical protein